MKKLLLFLTFVSLFTLQTLFAGENLSQQITQRLTKISSLYADFKQVKTLEGQSFNLKSSGFLKIKENKDIEWHQTAPFEQLFLLSSNGIKTSVDGEPAKELDESKNQTVSEMLSLIKYLIVGDINRLERVFTVNESGNLSNGWTLNLKPKEKPYDLVFNHIVLSGKDYIEKIDIYEAGGDRISIELSNIKQN